MNKYLACLSVIAFCFCLVEAMTRYELERLIENTNKVVRRQQMLAITDALNQAVATARTPQQGACAFRLSGPAQFAMNRAMQTALIAAKNQYSALGPAEVASLNPTLLSSQLMQQFTAASTLQDYINQINQC